MSYVDKALMEGKESKNTAPYNNLADYAKERDTHK